MVFDRVLKNNSNIIRKCLLLSLAMLVSFIAAGCWDAFEIEDYLLVTLSAVDYSHGNTQLYIEFIVPNPSKGEDGKKGEESEVITGIGSNILEARNNYKLKYGEDKFFGSSRATIYTNNYAENGIKQDLDRLRALVQYSKSIHVITTSTPLSELLDSKKLGIENVGMNIAKLEEQSEKNGIFFGKTIRTALEESLLKNTGYHMGNLDIVDNTLKITGYSIFSNNKQIGFIDETHMKGVNNLIGYKARANYYVDFENIGISLSTLLEKRNIKAQYANGEINFNIRLELKAEIMDMTQMIELDEKMIKKLNMLLSEEIKSDILNTIRVSQYKYRCDYLYMYKVFRAKYNSAFQKMNWNDEYQKASFNVEVYAKAFPARGISMDE